MLELLVLGAGALQAADFLLEAQRRRSSNARAAFSAAVADPMLKSADHSPLGLASLLAAEERHADQTVLPTHVEAQISREIEFVVAPAAQRLSLSRRLDTEPSPEAVVAAVVSSLFGTGSPDDAAAVGDAAQGFFSGNAADYYDPRNSFLDDVLQRRQGIPISLSLIAMDACSQLGVPMVGLNAPSHLLLAPADKSLGFVVDCFGAGILHDDAAADFVAQRLGARVASASEDARLVAGRRALNHLRASPMTSLQWGARMLRNLRGVYAMHGDVVRLLGVCDRLRSIGAHSRLAVSDDEMRSCSLQLAHCIFLLRWEGRRNEARLLLQGLLRYSEQAQARFGDAFASDEETQTQIESLLAEAWFAAPSASQGE
jgi:regulator of sirC expression with transglutaminase-like and TPR domain